MQLAALKRLVEPCDRRHHEPEDEWHDPAYERRRDQPPRDGTRNRPSHGEVQPPDSLAAGG
eukprot:2397091-Prymnesium_polylepis.1